MNETSLFKLDGYISPKKLLADFYSLVSKEGKEAVLNRAKYRREREKWVAAMICIGMTKVTGKPWFVKIPESDPPDFFAAAFRKLENSKLPVWDEVSAEIVECPKHLLSPDCQDAEQAVFDHVNKTKLSKAYPPHYCLVIHSRFAWRGFKLEKLSKLFLQRKPALFAVYDLMNVSPDGSRYLGAELYPKCRIVEIDSLDLEIK